MLRVTVDEEMKIRVVEVVWKSDIEIMVKVMLEDKVLNIFNGCAPLVDFGESQKE